MNRLKNNENCRLLLKILIIFAISRLIMLIMVPVYNGIMGTHRSFLFLMNEWDAKKYAYIINHGYTHPTDIDPQANWAFFPLYVIVCAALKAVTGGLINTYVIGMIVSNICIIIAAFFAVKGLKKQTSIKEEYTMIMPVLLFMAPYTFYCSSVYGSDVYNVHCTFFLFPF